MNLVAVTAIDGFSALMPGTPKLATRTKCTPRTIRETDVQAHSVGVLATRMCEDQAHCTAIGMPIIDGIAVLEDALRLMSALI